jgi:hypothetical protein
LEGVISPDVLHGRKVGAYVLRQKSERALVDRLANHLREGRLRAYRDEAVVYCSPK